MSVTIKATLMWACLEVPNDDGKYAVDLCNLSPAAVNALEELGISARTNPNKPDKGVHITCKSNRPIAAFDPDGQKVDGRLVGNGSAGVAKITSYEWKYKAKAGVSPTLNRLVVTDLVIYEGAEEEGDDTPMNVDEAL